MADEQEAAEQKGGQTRKLMPCASCGRDYARERQVQRLQKKVAEEVGDSVDTGLMELCPPCRRKRYAGTLVAARTDTES